MNNNYFDKNIFPGGTIYSGNTPIPNRQTQPIIPSDQELMPLEQSYIENILRLNIGKKATVHMTFPDSAQFRDREFRGIIEQSGRDHIILSDPTSGTWYLLLMIYLDFITFDEKINYNPQFLSKS